MFSCAGEVDLRQNSETKPPGMVPWQFVDKTEILFPLSTDLKVVGEPVLGADGISVAALRPAIFQNVRTVSEVKIAFIIARKEMT